MTIDALVARISATLVDQLGAVRTGACALSPIRRHFAPFCLGAARCCGTTMALPRPARRRGRAVSDRRRCFGIMDRVGRGCVEASPDRRSLCKRTEKPASASERMPFGRRKAGPSGRKGNIGIAQPMRWTPRARRRTRHGSGQTGHPERDDRHPLGTSIRRHARSDAAELGRRCTEVPKD